MHGTLLDQKVFEALVGRCLPMISEHLASVDVQLSVACLPYVPSAFLNDAFRNDSTAHVGTDSLIARCYSWFLSLYINSMPLIFAFRVIDCFVAMGPKVLFQIALAILKQNGEALLGVTDDGMLIRYI